MTIDLNFRCCSPCTVRSISPCRRGRGKREQLIRRGIATRRIHKSPIKRRDKRRAGATSLHRQAANLCKAPNQSKLICVAAISAIFPSRSSPAAFLFPRTDRLIAERPIRALPAHSTLMEHIHLRVKFTHRRRGIYGPSQDSGVMKLALVTQSI